MPAIHMAFSIASASFFFGEDGWYFGQISEDESHWLSKEGDLFHHDFERMAVIARAWMNMAFLNSIGS